MATQTEKTTAFVVRPLAETPIGEFASVDQLVLPVGLPLPPAQRLVVMVPAGLTAEMALAQHIWALAQVRCLPVLFVGRVSRVEDEPGLRRRLALLAALTRDKDRVRADFCLSVGAEWLGLLRSLWRPGDLVVCHAEQSAPLLALGQPIGRALTDRLGTPVYVLNGYCEPEESELARLGRQIVFWVGAFAVVAAFFWLQVTVQQLTQDWMQTVVLILTVFVEFGLLAAWNRWLN